ncbi:MAG: ribose-phosphate pyrophosphokinase-like domain-containing protein, partial [Defluviitaleaceae bacterium]|nr:ribose-phosphate pyrophosphokinase-like domain-containing protein [Defluviitaleaceae bacterium]
MKVKNVDFHADLGIIALKSHSDFAAAIDGHIVNARRKQGLDTPDSFIIPTQQHRFSNGEGKIILKETARAKDIYVICDVGNYSCTYELYGHLNRMGPDEHFQDIKRAVAAIGGKAARV